MKQVTDGIYRSARPTYEELKTSGVKTIINLEDEDGAIEQERRWCGELRIVFIPYGLSEIRRPKKDNLNFIVREALKEGFSPLFLWWFL